jgi:ribosomal protein L11 methyltransferase
VLRTAILRDGPKGPRAGAIERLAEGRARRRRVVICARAECKPKLDAMLDAVSPEAPSVLYLASIEVCAQSADRIGAALEAAEAPPAVAVALFDRGRDRVEVSAQYAEEPARDELIALLQRAAGTNDLGALRIEQLADRDWVAQAEAMRGPVRAGRFLLHGAHDRGKIARGRCTFEIDAGLAFGTAHHASTRGCLLALDALFKRRRPSAVLDIGTGTGILAIAAAKVLGRRVVATDTDAKAVAVTVANAKTNLVAPFVSVVQAAGLAHPRLRRFHPDLLLANLTPPVLLALATSFARHVVPGGIAVLSGIEQADARKVEARYRGAGFILKSRILLDGWTTLILVRRNMNAVRD